MRKEILKRLDKSEYISGETLAKELNVSRTAIWKQIKNLEKLGYKIESVKNKGYRLVLKPDIPLPDEIIGKIDTKIIGKNIKYFKEINSTNIALKEQLKNNVKEGFVIVSGFEIFHIIRSPYISSPCWH